ncbi:MAG: lipopolysaccharide biosynthesis protein [Gemmatimonadales bacterium]
MSAESVAAGRPAALGSAARRGEARGLTRRASLTAAAGILDYAAKALVYVVVTPILVSGLGRTVYGIWEMLSRLGGYMTVTDGRSTEALRLVIAQKQESPDDGEKRRTVGAALMVWLLMLPVVLAAGVVLVAWVAPALIRPEGALQGDVQLTLAILAGAFVATSLGLVPESVLRGMNLGYKRVGVQASLNILGGALAAAAVWQGLGLVGLAAAQAVKVVLAGLVFWMLVRRFVSWWGTARPTRPEVRALFGMSLWLMAGDAVAKLLLATDVLILGAIVAPAVVTTYALTGYAARTAVGLHVFAAGAAMPGLGGLLGAGEHDRAAAARREMLVLTWLFVTVIGGAILLWNPAFIRLWVGPENYAGAGIDLLIVLIAVQTAFIRTDAYLLDAALEPKARVLVASAAAVVTIGLTIPLTHLFGLPGLCAGLLAGRGVQSVAYPLLVRRSLRHPRRHAGGLRLGLRLGLVSGGLFAGCAALGRALQPVGWIEWGAGLALSLPVIAGLALLGGPDATTRRALLSRLHAMASRGAHP